MRHSDATSDNLTDLLKNMDNRESLDYVIAYIKFYAFKMSVEYIMKCLKPVSQNILLGFLGNINPFSKSYLKSYCGCPL